MKDTTAPSVPNQPLKLLSPAKLNLFLHINGQRPDGYHELQTCFQLLNYGDDMHFEPNQQGRIEWLSSLAGVPDQDNLILRAVETLKPYRSDKMQGVSIRLHKRLPMGGGLGGGSSNAATTLLALNYLWALNLSLEQLAHIGLSLGADVPVFVLGQTGWAEGIGESIMAIPGLPSSWFLVVIPNCQVETKKIFNNKGLTRNTPKCKMGLALRGAGYRPDFYSQFRNDCESIARQIYSEIGAALDLMKKFGQARMTGTGCCVFSEFETQRQAMVAMRDLPADVSAFVAEGVSISPVHNAILGM